MADDECLDEEALQDALQEEAFVVIHSAPATGPKDKGSAAAVAAAHNSLRLAAFPETFASDPPEQRLARMEAWEQCWGALAQHIQEVLRGTDAAVFQALLEFARSSHPAASITIPGFPGAGVGCQRMPTALVLAGGVNSADHSSTFPSLAAHLREQGCYVALLQPHSFGKAPGDVIGEVLRQMSGLTASKAEHMAALVQWYQDEAGDGTLPAPREQLDAPEAVPEAVPAGGSATQPRKPRQEEAADEEEEAEHQEEAGQQSLTQQARKLRSRLPAAAQGEAELQEAARRRPLVVILEGTESADVQCLRDFILTASEAYHEVPLTLMLGLTTSADALHDLLPSEVTDRCMDLQHYKLASAMTRLDSLVKQVLLGGSGRWPGLLFSEAIVDRLTTRFFNHFYSSGSIVQGLKVAALSHFRSQPLSVLAAAVGEGRAAVLEACASLDPVTRAEFSRRLGSRAPAGLADAVTEAVTGWSRWAVGVHWLILAGEAVELRGIDLQPWKLAEEAMRQGFADGQLKQLLGKMEPLLRKLPPPAVQQLASQLQTCAEGVFGGVDAVAEHLEQLAPFTSCPLAAAGDSGEGKEEKEKEQMDEEEKAAPAAVPAAAAAAAQDGSGAAKKRQKHQQHRSAQGRKAALLEKVAQQNSNAAAKGKGSAAAAAAERARAAAAPAARFASWLTAALRDLLAAVPTKLPGAAVFTCRDAGSLDCLTAEPRGAIHAALTEPHLYLPGLRADMGVNAAQEDAVLAYTLFDQDPKCANLADWYQAFVEVHRGAASGGGSGPGSAKRRKAKVKKAKRPEGGAGGGDQAVSVPPPEDEAEERRWQRELAARFSQATAELQYVGLIKPSRRRRGDYVQRLVHQPALG